MPEPIGGEPFEGLLLRLAPDRESAGLRYEELRRRLVAVFEYRRCPHPEELADETLDRAARRLAQLGDDFVGSDPARFVFGVAWNVARESYRRPVAVALPEGWDDRVASTTPSDEAADLDEACLEACLGRLSAADRDLVLGYHTGERSDRIRGRSDIARDLGLSPNALRLKVHRLTARLRECVIGCVEHGGLVPARTGS
jgi:DNA-directed RNA polymerase specialized sigma24 family protein